jgi:phage baseplate assembly protein W
MPIGLTMPFARASSSQGYLAFSTTEVVATSYNLKALLLTNWGERPDHFYLGCNLIEFLFGQQNNETKEKITQRIETQVAQWLPYVTLDKIEVTFEEKNHGVIVKLAFSLKGRQNMSSVLEIAVAPPGG